MADEYTVNDASKDLANLSRIEKEDIQATKSNTEATRSLERAFKSFSGGGGARTPGAPASSSTANASGGAVMGGALASVPAPPTAGGGAMMGANILAGALGVFSGGMQIAGAGLTAGYNLMPEVQPTINRATQFYNASVAMGGTMPRNRLMQRTYDAMKGGMTSVGSDGMVAEYLSSRGMVDDGSRNGTYMQTVRSVSNAAKYLNMSNDRAVAAIEGLTSGPTSRSMLQNLGIYTSDLSTGKAKTQGQIMSEIASRLTAGRGQATAAEVEDSFRRGNLGASLAGLGLSEDQQLIMKQFLVEQAKGNYLDLSNDQTVAKLAADAGVNPNQSPMTIMGMQTGAMNKATDAYIKGMKDAVPWVEKLTTASGNLAQQFGEFKSAIETIASTREGGAIIGALGSAMQGLTSIVSGLGAALMGVLSMIGMGGLGAGAAGAAGAGAAGAGAAGMSGAALAVPFMAAGAVVTAQTMSLIEHQTAKAKHDGSYEKLVKKDYAKYHKPDLKKYKDDNPLGILGNVGINMANQYAAAKRQQEQDVLTAYAKEDNGPSSTISASGPSGSAGGKGSFTFIMPVNGKVVQGYGPRDSFMTNSGKMSSSFHNGIDIAASEGTPIHASAEGQVTFAAPSGGFGNLMKIKHPNGFTTFYAHQSRFGASAGSKVRQGEVIGYVGTTGNSTGPHLHFEVHDENGSPMDPMKVLNGSFTGAQEQGSNPNHKTSGAGAGVSPDLNAIIDQRALAGAQPPSSHSGSSYGQRNIPGGTDRYGSGSVAGMPYGKGNRNLTSGKNNLTNNRMSISLPGLEGYKTGRSYVPQDGPVNVHAGEAILTAEQAEVWRSALRSGMSGKSNNVTINLTIGTASDAEAERFAGLVKRYLEDDQMIHTMGSK